MYCGGPKWTVWTGPCDGGAQMGVPSDLWLINTIMRPFWNKETEWTEPWLKTLPSRKLRMRAVIIQNSTFTTLYVHLHPAAAFYDWRLQTIIRCISKLPDWENTSFSPWTMVLFSVHPALRNWLFSSRQSLVNQRNNGVTFTRSIF